MTKDKLIQNNYEVVIVGGGPAGIATALTLNALGISHCVVEAAKVPKHKIGEALPPNAKPILKQLGLDALMRDKRHLKYYGNKSSWGTNQLAQKDFITDIHGHGFLLDRLHFENQLWAHYRKKRGLLFTTTKLKKIDQHTNGAILTIDDGQQLLNVNCNYVVDATGRKATVCRHLGVHKNMLDSQFAFSFTYKLKHSLERQILVEAAPNGWWYAAPNKGNELTVMYFTLKALLPKNDQIHSFLSKEIDASIYLSKIISANCLSNISVNIIPAGTSRLEIPYGNNWVAVGDAAFSFDPISSYGITSALAAGYYAGQAIASTLSGKIEAKNAYRYIVEKAFNAYTEKLVHQYSLEQRWPKSFYWKNRFN